VSQKATKTIGLLTTGIPDPSQGGSGIFNYLVCQYLLSRGHAVKAICRVNKKIMAAHMKGEFLKELEEQGLRYELIEEQPDLSPAFGWNLLLKYHQYRVCREAVENRRSELEALDGCLSLDLGWAVALAPLKVPSVCLLGDPLDQRWKYGRLDNRSWAQWLKLKAKILSVRWGEKRLPQALKRMSGGPFIVGSFGHQHAQHFRSLGLDCRHFRFFSPPVPGYMQVSTKTTSEPLIALHVGALQTSASRTMLNYWTRELLPELGKRSLQLEIRFVGRYDPIHQISSPFKNIRFSFAGHIENLEDEFKRADVFLAPMNYPVGVRTRVITALSYGVPVVADRSVALGLQELSHGREILYGSNATDVANCLQNAYQDRSTLTHMSASARGAWEKYYDPARNIQELLEPLGAQ
jgi:glycosyltransferase involved in cell wall biosynthesis